MLAGLLALMFLILAGGLAWQQLLIKPYVQYHNGWVEANAGKIKDDLQAAHPDWQPNNVNAAFAKMFLYDYDETENRQMLRRVLEPGPRGNILDRKGRDLVVNKPRYSVVLYLDELHPDIRNEFNRLRQDWLAQHHDDTTETKPTTNTAELMRQARWLVVQGYLDKANALLGRQDVLDPHDLDVHVSQNLLPYTLMKDLSDAQYARFNALWPVDSPMQTSVEALRYYPHGSLAFHTLGYVSLTDEIAAEDVPGANLPAKDNFTYKGMKGKTGLEALFDSQLSGKTGGEIWVVDPAMRLHERVAQKTPEKGADLQCSLDIDIQRAAEEALLKGDGKAPYTGAAVALDIRTGEVLAMASSPTFDLNRTVPNISYGFDNEVNAADGWLNRASQGLYAPGSTFKLISTIAGMRAGLLDATTNWPCPAFWVIGDRAFHDDSRADQGNLTVVNALRISNDVFYFKFGQEINQLDKNLLPAEARRFGLGQRTGIGTNQAMPEPLNMIVPDAAWKKKNHPEDNGGRWTDADAAMLAVGQSYLFVTPLQMACVAASIARDETRTQPTLIHSPTLDPATVKHGGESIGLPPEQRQLLIEGMEEVVTSGTGTNVQIPGIRIAAKTGTAQTGTRKNTTIAWFVCFAPVENPRIAVAVAIESPVAAIKEYYGGTISAPIARAILQEYFKDYPETQK